jgi:DNA-binding NtrC family response regulator
LLFRLNVIPIVLPALRERPNDIPALVRHFTALHRARTGHPAPSWTPEAVALLARYRWPGNVRELGNIVERLAILHAGCAVDAAAVRAVLPIARETPPEVSALPDPASLERPLSDTLDEYERMLITRALSTAGGNIAEAARRLRTDRPNLYRRMRRLGIATADD